MLSQISPMPDRGPGSVEPGGVRSHLAQILASPAFATAKSAGRFLRYVVEETLAGHGGQLKEYVIGVEVFGRGEGFDPRADAVVRVEATRLRQRLREYYRSDGRSDRIAIEIPKGGYIPVFRSLGPATVQSIAVMPLENLSGDDAPEYFAVSLTEALIGELARIRKLRVISGSALAAGEVQVGALVEGSVTRSGGRVRIDVRVVHPETLRRLWSQTYDRDVREILALQREVANAIAAEVRAETPREQMQIGSTRAVNPEAYDQYLRGRFYSQRQNKDDTETAISSLERAVAIDPNFASAYAELAQAYVWKLFLFAPDERQCEENAFVAVEKALALDPDLAVAHLARGRLLWTPANHFPHEKAIREYRRALALNPNLDEARNQLALVYCHIGYFEQAFQESREAVLTNPNNNLAVYRTAQTLAFLGEYDKALSVLLSIPQEANPALIGYQTAWVQFNLGKKAEASATIEQLVRDYPEDFGLYTSVQAVIAAAAGDERTAESKIEVALRTGKGFGHFHHTAYHIAIAFALLHKVEQAIKWLDAAARDGFPCYPLFESDANLDHLRQDPGFIQFMAKLKLHWEEYRILF